MNLRFDVDLFRQLNAEYADKPLVPAPRSFDSRSLERQARRRAKNLDARLDLRGRRVLEIGTGHGHLARVLASDYGCQVVGVDIQRYESWNEPSPPGCQLLIHDVTADHNGPLGDFDRIVSLAVFEHVERPIEGIHAIGGLLRPDGTAYVSANLYRGPKASHRYRQIFFPFPHLLFTDDVIAEFYSTTRHRHTGAAWVNKMTAAQYREAVADAGMSILSEWFDTTPLDEDFYERFIEVLGRYPRSDLERDFIHIVVRRPAEPGIARRLVGAVRPLSTRVYRRTRSIPRRVRRRWSRTS